MGVCEIGYDVIGLLYYCIWDSSVIIVAPPTPIVSSGKRRHTVTLSTVAQSQTFQIESSGGEESQAGIAAYTSQQAALFGEAVASELETRTVEPFVTSE